MSGSSRRRRAASRHASKHFVRMSAARLDLPPRRSLTSIHELVCQAPIPEPSPEPSQPVDRTVRARPRRVGAALDRADFSIDDYRALRSERAASCWSMGVRRAPAETGAQRINGGSGYRYQAGTSAPKALLRYEGTPQPLFSSRRSASARFRDVSVRAAHRTSHRRSGAVQRRGAARFGGRPPRGPGALRSDGPVPAGREPRAGRRRGRGRPGAGLGVAARRAHAAAARRAGAGGRRRAPGLADRWEARPHHARPEAGPGAAPRVRRRDRDLVRGPRRAAGPGGDRPRARARPHAGRAAGRDDPDRQRHPVRAPGRSRPGRGGAGAGRELGRQQLDRRQPRPVVRRLRAARRAGGRAAAPAALGGTLARPERRLHGAGAAHRRERAGRRRRRRPGQHGGAVGAAGRRPALVLRGDGPGRAGVAAAGAASPRAA